MDEAKAVCPHTRVEWKTKLLDGGTKPGDRVLGWCACAQCGLEFPTLGILGAEEYNLKAAKDRSDKLYPGQSNDI